MPPPTTLLGIAGAALGLSDRELWAPASPVRTLKVSVWMEEEPGRARDMWTVLKIKSGKIAERSPYFRELLFFVRYTLFYGGSEDLLHQVERAFRDPAYPLSLGREDELMLVEAISRGEAAPGAARFRGTVLPTDIRRWPGMRPNPDGPASILNHLSWRPSHSVSELIRKASDTPNPLSR
jgi:CRISPR-associated protein Cas5t